MHQKTYNNQFGKKPKTLADLQKGLELLLDECCATDITASEGLGCDNMTAIIVEINNDT
jgi:serine/threonine protein phosphatase PrpC